ncbi:hypothetical protein CTAM01_04848 [Colletotrichum tamarilloi]|uniref:WW domain-containing protein n=1 Tax=Colletotrichum tamarilloi TaxID=1209934 RepID=A0ABQ9RFP8_9PEZI|nr:uncharacterized protein CTAM01_04848 [Colletotrichum tamarilloi]KAK1502859.1 hypothetical protein CTAM01_04848 [Colletotrichum tamarilloi]
MAQPWENAPQFGIRLSQGHTSYYRARSRVTTTKWSQPQAPPAEGNPRHGDAGATRRGRKASLEDFSETLGAVCSEHTRWLRQSTGGFGKADSERAAGLEQRTLPLAGAGGPRRTFVWATQLNNTNNSRRGGGAPEPEATLSGIGDEQIEERQRSTADKT